MVAWLAIWQLLYLAIGHDLLLSSPFATVQRLCELAVTSNFWLTVGRSMARIMLGFSLAFVIGAICAILTYKSVVIYSFLAPAMNILKATPVASFAIIALVWVSGKNLSAFCAFVMVLPISWTGIDTGLRTADEELLEMAWAFRLPCLRILFNIRLPALLPHMNDVLRVGISFAWKTGVAGEVISIPRGTIGAELYNAKVTLETVDLIAWTATIIIISVILERLFVLLTTRFTMRKGEKR